MRSAFKTILILSLTLVSSITFAQDNKLISLEALVNKTDPAWPLVKKWIDSAKNKVEILPVDSAKAKEVLYNSQMTTYATLGSVIYNTGGILVDNGWIRILGSGSERLSRNVAEWNKGKTIKEYGDNIPYLLIADDAVGGFFAINYGGLGKDIKNVYYLEPNSLTWQPLGAGYGEFLVFCFDSDLSKFYKGLRWSSWNQFIANLDGTKTYSFRPYLWEEGTDIDKCTRKLVGIEEMYRFNIMKSKELNADKGIKKDDTQKKETKGETKNEQ
ncbi:DUF2625 domain-containing protein [Pedobacter kyonggii]|uniref:DUF2625 domain-containing protein n=1 Tax=Pedobacter kyonggii TaxID=1926871 RepID=A0A4Q9H6Z0_9SPHI|nr:DUF2625 domain-containing protein [Pedobacter kyonggii]TBO39564.1 DUF2625 domain-containing protein [Pedobacter kyonggii]